MIVDASALCAILFIEPERDEFLEAIGSASAPLISPVQHWEAMVAASSQIVDGAAALNRLIAGLRIRVADIGPREAALAFEAWERFGKRRHPAGLNLGDCFAYGLAKARDMPLLYKGDDFSRTDVTSAL